MLEKLTEQTAAAKDGAKAVGELLLELCADDTYAAELVEQDLDNPGMSLDRCFEKMRNAAQKKQKGGCYYMPPKEAEKMVREFYGIPEKRKAAPKVEPQTPAGILDLADLLEL